MGCMVAVLLMNEGMVKKAGIKDRRGNCGERLVGFDKQMRNHHNNDISERGNSCLFGQNDTVLRNDTACSAKTLGLILKLGF